MLKKLLLPLTCLLLSAGCLTPEAYIFHRKAEARQTLKLAVFAPLTGTNNAAAEQAIEGITLAVEEVNSGRGISGKRVDFKVFDTAGSPAMVMRQFQAARNWGADGVVAVGSKPEIDRAVAGAPAAKLPLMLPLNSEDKYASANEFVYRANYTDQQQTDVLAGYLHYWRQAGNMGIFVVNDQNLYRYRTIAADMSESLNRIGGKVIADMTLPAASLPDESFLEMLKSGPRSIMVLAEPVKSAEIIKKLRESGFNGVICSTDGWNSPEFFAGLAGSEPGECIFTSPIHQDEFGDNDAIRQFRTKFRKRFYHQPGSVEALCYDGTYFLMIALSSADDLLAFDKNWQTLRQYQGAAGIYAADKKGKLDRTVYLNSIGVERTPDTRRAYPRFSRKLMHSKLEEYSSKYYAPDAAGMN